VIFKEVGQERCSLYSVRNAIQSQEERYERYSLAGGPRKRGRKDMQRVGVQKEGQERSSVFESRKRDRNILRVKEAGIEYCTYIECTAASCMQN
jgi:hypothetical protein